MNIRLNILYLLILISSCEFNKKENESLVKENYKSQELNINYYPNGKIEFIESLKKNRREGQYYYFNKNGILEWASQFHDGKQCGEETYFDSTGRIKYCKTFFIQNGKTIGNESKVYDILGNIKKEASRFISISSSKDTLEVGDVHEISIRNEATGFPHTENVIKKVVIGNLDNQYRILDASSLKYIDFKNDQAIIEVDSKKIGDNYLRGFVLEKVHQKDGNMKVNPVFFTYKYYVKGGKPIAYPYDVAFFELITKIR